MAEPSRKLSTEEVNALMEGLRSGDLSTSTSIKDSGAVEYKTFNFDTVAGATLGSAFGGAFNSDGSKVYINTVSSGTGAVYAFNLSSNYDISTASYSSENDTHLHTTTAAQGQRNVAFADSFGRYYMTTTSGEVTQQSLAAVHTITLPSSVGQTPLYPSDSGGNHTTLAKDDRITFEFFTADGGTNVNLVNVERQA